MSKTGLFISLTWLTLVIFLAPAIDTYNFMSPAGRVTRDTPFYIRFLGEGRSILSNLSILQADLYLHGGVGHFHEEHPQGMAISDTAAEKPPHIHKGREHIGPADHGHAEETLSRAGRYNILLRIARAAEITEHIHLGRDEIQEVVPWLYYSAKIDPHNVLAYTLAGYWLADRMGRVNEAVSFLREGLTNNPDSWKLNAELGRIYFKHLKKYESAIRFLTRAQGLLQEAPHDRFEERYVLSFLAYSYKALGRADEALPLHRRIAQLFPEAANGGS